MITNERRNNKLEYRPSNILGNRYHPIKVLRSVFFAGLFLAHYVVKRIYVKENIPTENLEKLFFYVVVGTTLGARLGHCLFYDPLYYFQNPIEVLLPIKK